MIIINSDTRIYLEDEMFNIENFLDNNGLSLNINYSKEVDNFINQIIDKFNKKTSSLGMLNSYIHVEKNPTGNKKIIVIDAGGTNLRVSKIYIDSENRVNIDDFIKVTMPGVDFEVSLDEFYTYIAKQVIPFDSYSNNIGFCFSYPVELLDSTEGKILRMCKEIKAPQIVGSLVCENLNKKIVELGGRSKNIKLLNDSTATLLAGLTKKNDKYGSYIGYILGTGSNSCYIKDEYIYNLESGWYDGIPRGKFDYILDENSINPGKYFMEKATSGAYLGNLTTIILKALFNEGHLTEAPKDLTTKEINDFLLGKADICSSADKKIYKAVVDRVIKRSALYVSINLASLILESKSLDKPVCIVADGSTFHNLKNFQNMVEDNIKNMIPPGKKFEIISIENAPVVGAAISAILD